VTRKRGAPSKGLAIATESRAGMSGAALRPAAASQSAAQSAAQSAEVPPVRQSVAAARPPYDERGDFPCDALPPLALYIHVPWCVRKCPYCDFNSHAAGDPIPEGPYVERLLEDLAQDTVGGGSAAVTSVFIGGGTPSLLSAAAVARLLAGVRDRLELTAGGVAAARSAGFDILNRDLMFGLREQTRADAERDLVEALALGCEHLSYYQLTLEPNTRFHRAPPKLPDQDLAADMAEQGAGLLAAAGFEHYEVSAYARPGRRCRHNLNYWRFGDYLGIGAGAHGKLTLPGSRGIERLVKRRHPVAYLDPANRDRLVAGRHTLSESELILEFAMNALRLEEGFMPRSFERRTGLPFARIEGRIDKACAAGLLGYGDQRVAATPVGRSFLDDLLTYFA